MKKYALAIIGGGSGGLAAAKSAKRYNIPA